MLGREAKPNLKTKDFNKIKLESALLKTDYDSCSSNPSSMYTAQTGKRTLNERNQRKLGHSQHSGTCKCNKVLNSRFANQEIKG